MNKKIKVAIIGTTGLPARYGGWDQLLEHLTKLLSDKYQFYVYTSIHGAQPGLKTHNGAVIKIVRLKANGYQSVFYDGWSLLHASFKYDILLMLGASGCIYLPVFKKLCRKTVILNPDGAEWKRGKWNKHIKRYLEFSESLGVRHADKVVSDNKIMQEYFKDRYDVDSTLIAYGGDNATKQVLSEVTKEQYAIEAGNYAFKVCRIEPENNVEMILSAFAGSTVKLIMVGNWNNSSFGKTLRQKFQKFDNLYMVDAIYDQRKLNELRSNCGIYVHGHTVGGTNPSLVEAMNLGLNCLVFDVDYNRETTENKAQYFSTPDELAEFTKMFERKSPEILDIGSSMLEISKRRYLWAHVVAQYDELLQNSIT